MDFLELAEMLNLVKGFIDGYAKQIVILLVILFLGYGLYTELLKRFFNWIIKRIRVRRILKKRKQLEEEGE